MIGRVKGRVHASEGNVLLIDVGGLSYEVEVPTGAVAEAGAEVECFTHLVARDDGMTLFGFRSLAERRLFRVLIKVGGVGPKLALTLLSSLSPAALAECIANQDTGLLAKVPGIGKKTAQRIALELKDRLGELPVTGGDPMPQGAAAQAVAALVALGWRPAEARAAVRAADGDADTTEDLIRAALKRMAGAKGNEPAPAGSAPAHAGTPQ